MSSALRVTPGYRDALPVVVIVGVVLAGGAALFVFGLSTSLRNFGVYSALMVAAVAAFVSGNPRLFSLWGLMLTVPLTISNRIGPMFLGKQGGEDAFRIEISDVFLVVMIAFILWDLVTGRQRGIRIPKLTFPWVLLMGIGVIWIIVGPWRTTAAHETLRMAKVTILFLVVVNEARSPRRIWHCAAALAAGGMIQGTIGLAQYLKGGLFGLEFLGETSEYNIAVLAEASVQGAAVFRPSALLQHANLMGIFLAVVLPLAIALLMTSRRPGSRAFLWATIAVSCPTIVISLSRSAWLSAAVAVTLVFSFMMLHPKLRWRSLSAGAMVGVVAAGVLIGLSGPIIQRAFGSKNDSTVAREIYKVDARAMIADAPWLGHGLNSYVFELPRFTGLSMQTYGGTLPAVHNIHYLWWAETGIFGLLLFLTIWGSIIVMGVGNLLVRDELLFAVNAACLAAMICLIPDSFLSFTLKVNTMLRVFWVLAGLIVAIRYIRVREASRARAPSPAARALEADLPMLQPTLHG